MTFETRVAVRFRDLDAMGHVNNATYATYLEEARGAFFREVVGADLADVNTVLVALELEFHAPVDDGTVDVAVDLAEPGESSIPMRYELRQDGAVVATGETTQVVVDGAGEPRPIPDEWRERMAPHVDG